jgi:hypothetical protein
MKYQVNGIELNLRDQGQGDPVLVFLHYRAGLLVPGRELLLASRATFGALLTIIVVGATQMLPRAGIGSKIFLVMVRRSFEGLN